MKLICKDCRKFTNCTKPCEEIEEELKGLVGGGDSKEIPISQLGDTVNESSDAIQMDNFRNIDPGRVYDSEAEPEIDWDRITPQPEAADIDGSEERLLKDGIAFATRRENLKLRRRFNKFLRCDTISNIARRSGISKQSIQKQFQSVIKKVNKMLSQNPLDSETAITPLKFKKKVYSIYSQ